METRTQKFMVNFSILAANWKQPDSLQRVHGWTKCGTSILWTTTQKEKGMNYQYIQ